MASLFFLLFLLEVLTLWLNINSRSPGNSRPVANTRRPHVPRPQADPSLLFSPGGPREQGVGVGGTGDTPWRNSLGEENWGRGDRPHSCHITKVRCPPERKAFPLHPYAEAHIPPSGKRRCNTCSRPPIPLGSTPALWPPSLTLSHGISLGSLLSSPLNCPCSCLWRRHAPGTPRVLWEHPSVSRPGGGSERRGRDTAPAAARSLSSWRQGRELSHSCCLALLIVMS